MNNIISLVLALSLTSALACSQIRSGYVAGGLLRTPAGMTLNCGFMYRAFTKSMDHPERAELYFVSSGAIGQVGKQIGSALDAKGFKMLQSQDVNENGVVGKILSYANLSSGKVMVVTLGTAAGQVFVTFIVPR